jgi:hypothetical protein
MGRDVGLQQDPTCEGLDLRLRLPDPSRAFLCAPSEIPMSEIRIFISHKMPTDTKLAAYIGGRVLYLAVTKYELFMQGNSATARTGAVRSLRKLTVPIFSF